MEFSHLNNQQSKPEVMNTILKNEYINIYRKHKKEIRYNFYLYFIFRNSSNFIFIIIFIITIMTIYYKIMKSNEKRKLKKLHNFNQIIIY